jgi:hypothetical protein
MQTDRASSLPPLLSAERLGLNCSVRTAARLGILRVKHMAGWLAWGQHCDVETDWGFRERRQGTKALVPWRQVVSPRSEALPRAGGQTHPTRRPEFTPGTAGIREASCIILHVHKDKIDAVSNAAGPDAASSRHLSIQCMVPSSAHKHCTETEHVPNCQTLNYMLHVQSHDHMGDGLENDAFAFPMEQPQPPDLAMPAGSTLHDTTSYWRPSLDGHCHAPRLDDAMLTMHAVNFADPFNDPLCQPPSHRYDVAPLPNEPIAALQLGSHGLRVGVEWAVSDAPPADARGAGSSAAGVRQRPAPRDAVRAARMQQRTVRAQLRSTPEATEWSPVQTRGMRRAAPAAPFGVRTASAPARRRDTPAAPTRPSCYTPSDLVHSYVRDAAWDLAPKTEPGESDEHLLYCEERMQQQLQALVESPRHHMPQETPVERTTRAAQQSEHRKRESHTSERARDRALSPDPERTAQWGRPGAQAQWTVAADMSSPCAPVHGSGNTTLPPWPPLQHTNAPMPAEASVRITRTAAHPKQQARAGRPGVEYQTQAAGAAKGATPTPAPTRRSASPERGGAARSTPSLRAAAAASRAALWCRGGRARKLTRGKSAGRTSVYRGVTIK